MTSEPKYPWVYPEEEYVGLIEALLESSHFTAVEYEKPVYMAAFGKNPRTFLRFEASFYDEENKSWDVPAEYKMRSPTRNLMEEVLEYLLYMDADPGDDIYLDGHEPRKWNY